jgi:hypothetical protein
MGEGMGLFQTVAFHPIRLAHHVNSRAISDQLPTVYD